MRVARIIERLPPAVGGKEIHGAQLSLALRDAGIAQHVFCRAGSPLGPGIRQTRLGEGIAGNAHLQAAFALAAARSVQRVHQGRRFDLIHAHGDFLEALAAAIAGRRLGVPAVLTVHGGLSEVPSHHQLRLASFSAMEQVIAVSDSVAAKLREIGVSSPIATVASGVRDEFFMALRRPDKAPTIVTIGRLAPVKGIETLLKAHDALADSRVRWVVVAGGDDAYAQRMRDEIARRPTMTCIEDHDPGRLAALLGRATAFVQPSVALDRQHEGVPTSLLEAIAARVPVIATRTGGIPTVLEEGTVGHLVEPGDAAGIAAAVADVIAHPGAALNRAAAASIAGSARPWSEVAADTIARYELVSERSRRQSALLAVPWFDIGGAEKFVLSLARGFSVRGLRVAVAGAPGRMVGELEDDIEYVPLRRLRSFRDAGHNVLAFAGAASRLRPTGVNSHHVPIGILARLGSSVARVKARHVLTVHTTEDPRMAPIVGIAGSFAFCRVLCVAESVRDEYVRWALPWERSRFAVVRFGVDVPEPVRKEERSIGNIARLVGRKGHPILIEAWKQVMADARSAGWTLEIWGEGPDRPLLEQLIGSVPGVTLAGPVRDASQQVGQFEIVVLPSLREGLPLTLMEAMAAGCAVVASDLPGCREVLGNETGILVPPGDAEALSRALLELILDPGRRKRCAEAGQYRVHTTFSPQAMVDAYYAAMNDIDHATPTLDRNYQ